MLSKETSQPGREGNRVQIETDHLSYAGSPGQISQQQGTKVDADLSVAEQEALLGWLNDVEGEVGNEGTEDDAAALRRRLSGRPRRAARGDQAAPGGAARAGAADRRVERAGRRPRSTGSASTSGWSWRSRCAGSRTRCTAG